MPLTLTIGLNKQTQRARTGHFTELVLRIRRVSRPADTNQGSERASGSEKSAAAALAVPANSSRMRLRASLLFGNLYTPWGRFIRVRRGDFCASLSALQIVSAARDAESSFRLIQECLTTLGALLHIEADIN